MLADIQQNDKSCLWSGLHKSLGKSKHFKGKHLARSYIWSTEIPPMTSTCWFTESGWKVPQFHSWLQPLHQTPLCYFWKHSYYTGYDKNVLKYENKSMEQRKNGWTRETTMIITTEIRPNKLCLLWSNYHWVLSLSASYHRLPWSTCAQTVPITWL